MRFRLVPTDDKFFDLFIDTAHNVHNCALLLQKMVENLVDSGAQRDAILAAVAVNFILSGIAQAIPVYGLAL